MSWRLASACRVSPAMNSSATCRLNAALWDRCLVMASILRKPSKGGQSKTPNLSTRRGALQYGVPLRSRLTDTITADLVSDWVEDRRVRVGKRRQKVGPAEACEWRESEALAQ